MADLRARIYINFVLNFMSPYAHESDLIGNQIKLHALA